MEEWPIIKMTIGHCVGALIISAAFSGTEYVLGLMFRNELAREWIGHIELALEIIVPTMLALAFISSFSRILFDIVIKTWKGFPHDKTNIILA
jgi:hypothetical protein